MTKFCEASNKSLYCSFSELGASARSIWSKSDPGEGPGHNLLAHMLDVAAVSETILEREPASTRAWAVRAFGLPDRHSNRWIAGMAGLHDFGKAIPGFAAKWPAGRNAIERAGLRFPEIACDRANHSLATAALLAEPLHHRTGIGIPWIRAVVQAISAHHGRHFSSIEKQRGRPFGEPPAWAAAREEILAAYWQALSPRGDVSPVEPDLVAVNWLAGLTSTADWIASNPDWFPLGERHDDLQSYYAHSKQLAVTALDAAGWRSGKALLQRTATTSELLERVRGKPTEPRPLQDRGDELLKSANGPSLLLVEAPMGEGKTELAFLAHLRLQAANDHRGLYVALPTQATGNALFTRTQQFLNGFVFRPTDIQLVHGGAAMNEEVRHLRGVAHSREETLSASAWFSQRRRPLLSAYGVGTVDQALLAALNVKHHFVRLWGLGNRVVVFDEVHAYDTYTGELITALLRWLKAMGSSVVLMSATLPRKTRDSLVAAWGAAPADIPTLDYPRVTLVDADGPRGAHAPARALAPIELHGMDESLDAIAEKAVALVSQGGCGAIIVNTVDRAQRLYQQITASCPELEIVLFHARYPANQRGEREDKVLKLFGEGDQHRPKAALMIATQVAEQSLDLDFDFMISDLAPVDLLLQRAGRMYRHDRVRPAQHDCPRLWVAGLTQDRLPSLKETAWGYIYAPYWLGRTWAFLRDESTLRLPADIDRLVQTVYSDEPVPVGVPETINEFIEIEAYGEHLGEEQGKRQLATNISIDIGAEPLEAYNDKPFGGDDELGIRNQTRLGPDSVSVVPVDITEAGWRVAGRLFDPTCVPDDDTARALYERQLRLSRKAVVIHFHQSELPIAFAEHPILRHLYPLPLIDGRGDVGGQKLRLDPDMGLIYIDDRSE